MQSKVMLADDHLLFMEGLQYLLEAYGIQVVGKAKTGREALTKARVLKPDIILMDIKMPEISGLEALRLIKAEMPDMKILMLTTSDEDEDLFTAVKYGASGYLYKNTDAKELCQRIQQVEDGEIPLSPGLAAKILMEFKKNYGTGKIGKKNGKTPESNQLTGRHLEILQIIASGKTYKKAAEMLGLSERTVKYHMGRIVELLHLENKAQAIAYATGSGLLEGTRSKPACHKEN